MDYKMIVDGHKEFLRHKEEFQKELFMELAEIGQSPTALFVTCSDSRVAPNLITNTKPGDMFITRNIGNLIPPYKADSDYHSTTAVIEYAVHNLDVPHIIICGHSDCGAIKTALKPRPNIIEEGSQHIYKWLELTKPAIDESKRLYPTHSQKDLQRLTEKTSVIYQLENLKTYPLIQKKIAEGKLELHGWHYDIATGNIKYYDEDKKIFEPLTELDL